MGARLLQPTLTAGEISPSLWGRVDLARYASGLKQCRNFIVRPYGGVENRPGLYFCADTELDASVDAGIHRVIPFVYSTEVAYQLVLGDEHVRVLSEGSPVLPATTAYSAVTTYGLDVYVTDAGITYRSLQAGNLANTPATSPAWWVADAGLQFSAPWAAADIFDLKFTQSADVMWFTHPDYPPTELRRLAVNEFEVREFVTKEGPFLELNNDEAFQVAAGGVQGTVTITSTKDMFTANAIGSLLYIESKNLGQVKPWVVGDRSVAVGDQRRNDGKTYKATDIPAAGTWHETGPRAPIHDTGRTWDGAGDTKTNGVDTWSVGIEWEYVDSGYGVVKIIGVTNARTATAEVQKRLPQQVVGGAGAVGLSWTLSGDGVTTVFSIVGALYGVYTVTIDGADVQQDPNYVPPDPGTDGGSTNAPTRDDGGYNTSTRLP